MRRLMSAILLIAVLFAGAASAERMALGLGFEIDLSDGYTVISSGNGSRKMRTRDGVTFDVSVTEISSGGLTVEMMEGMYGAEWPAKFAELMATTFGAADISVQTINGMQAALGCCKSGYKGSGAAVYAGFMVNQGQVTACGIAASEDIAAEVFSHIYASE